jgi:hypothetical protein
VAAAACNRLKASRDSNVSVDGTVSTSVTARRLPARSHSMTKRRRHRVSSPVISSTIGRSARSPSIGGFDYSFIRYGTTGEAQNVTLGPLAQGQSADTFSLNGQDGPGPSNSGDSSEVSLGLTGAPGFLSSTTTLTGLQLDPSLPSPGGALGLFEDFKGDIKDAYQIAAEISSISPMTPTVPEPSTLVIFGQAILLVGGYGLRKCRERRA